MFTIFDKIGPDVAPVLPVERRLTRTAVDEIDRDIADGVLVRGAEKTFDNAEKLYVEAEILAKAGATARALCRSVARAPRSRPLPSFR